MSLHCVKESTTQPIPIQRRVPISFHKSREACVESVYSLFGSHRYAFIHRVVGTIRPWREYTTSLRRLYDMEDAFLQRAAEKEGALLSPYEMAVLQRGTLHPALEWWRKITI